MPAPTAYRYRAITVAAGQTERLPQPWNVALLLEGDGLEVSSESVSRSPFPSGVRVRLAPGRVDDGLELHNPTADPVAAILAWGLGDITDNRLIVGPDEWIQVVQRLPSGEMAGGMHDDPASGFPGSIITADALFPGAAGAALRSLEGSRATAGLLSLGDFGSAWHCIHGVVFEFEGVTGGFARAWLSFENTGTRRAYQSSTPAGDASVHHDSRLIVAPDDEIWLNAEGTFTAVRAYVHAKQLATPPAGA